VNPNDYAVIFDVDGVLLELTASEEDVFFGAFAEWCPPGSLSRDWNSYRIRNDDDIVDEIMQVSGIDPSHKSRIVQDYLRSLQQHLKAGTVHARAIPGAAALLSSLTSVAMLGIATANFREAAKMRLLAEGLWEPVAALAFGADGGGHKHDILSRAIAAADLPAHRIVYIGDNVSDVEAGLRHGVHFIGFSTSARRREALAAAGAPKLAHDHATTQELIHSALRLTPGNPHDSLTQMDSEGRN
jgi:HAD superfamily hydrolase (TIGR01549 family)